jgi:putative salt-induced outer membrane protein
MSKIFSLGASATALLIATPAQATLPDPVRAMIEAAILSEHDADIQSVVKLAKATNPDDISEIDAMLAGYISKKQQRAEIAKAEKMQAGFFKNWSGQGEAGAFRSTGNSSNTGLSGGLKLTKEATKWRFKFNALADYQRSNGVTTREQFTVALEPDYRLNDRLYAYGLAQYDRDRFQGFSARYTLSSGLGYAVIDKDHISLDIKTGPAWRKTAFVGGGSDSHIAGLVGLDFNWQISDNLKLTEAATTTFESGNQSFTSITALDTRIVGALSARFSYSIEHETNPPAGRIKTDTLSRATLVYDF